MNCWKKKLLSYLIHLLKGKYFRKPSTEKLFKKFVAISQNVKIFKYEDKEQNDEHS